MSKKNDKKNATQAPKTPEAASTKPKKDKAPETPKAEETKVEEVKVEEVPLATAEITAETPAETPPQAVLPGVDAPKPKNPLDVKEKAAPKEKKAPKEFTLKNELEALLIEGKSNGEIIELLTPKVAKACNKDDKWANARIKQELGFFKNYCGHVAYKLDVLDALVDELTGLVTITGIKKDSSERIKEILLEMKTYTGEPAAVEPVTK